MRERTPPEHTARFQGARGRAGRWRSGSSSRPVPEAVARPSLSPAPSFVRLVLARDLEGAQSSYLADERAYGIVRELDLANRVVPVVGNLAGGHAVRAIGDVARGFGLTVSALYASNVEFYLWQDGTFGSYAANVASLPVPAEGVGVLIRSYFLNPGGRHPYAVPGSFSTQTVQTLSSFQEAVASTPYRGYWDLVTRDAVDPRPVGAANR